MARISSSLTRIAVDVLSWWHSSVAPFEYQGRSAPRRAGAYLPRTVWDAIEQELIDEVESITVGPAEDFTNFMSAVTSTVGPSTRSRATSSGLRPPRPAPSSSEGAVMMPRGTSSNRPSSSPRTLIQEAMVEEIFRSRADDPCMRTKPSEEVLDLCDRSSPYALTGSVFSDDETNIDLAFGKAAFHG